MKYLIALVIILLIVYSRIHDKLPELSNNKNLSLKKLERNEKLNKSLDKIVLNKNKKFNVIDDMRPKQIKAIYCRGNNGNTYWIAKKNCYAGKQITLDDYIKIK